MENMSVMAPNGTGWKMVHSREKCLVVGWWRKWPRGPPPGDLPDNHLSTNFYLAIASIVTSFSLVGRTPLLAGRISGPVNGDRVVDIRGDEHDPTAAGYPAERTAGVTGVTAETVRELTGTAALSRAAVTVRAVQPAAL